MDSKVLLIIIVVSAVCVLAVLAVFIFVLVCLLHRRRYARYTLLHGVSKTHHYIFDDNLDVNCPITIIFGTLNTQFIGH